MAEIIAEKPICAACGTEAREGAAFCYHCGAPVADLSVAPKNNGDKRPPDNTAENRSETIAALPSDEIETDKTATRLRGEEDSDEKSADEKVEPELISAAKMRRRPKSFQRKRVEISWEEPTGASSAIFIVAAVLLVLFAVGIWFLANYLK